MACGCAVYQATSLTLIIAPEAHGVALMSVRSYVINTTAPSCKTVCPIGGLVQSLSSGCFSRALGLGQFVTSDSSYPYELIRVPTFSMSSRTVYAV